MGKATTLYFWGRGKVIPPRVRLRAARRIKREIRFSAITPTWLPFRHGVKIEEVLPDALLIKREEGRTRTIALISENIGSKEDIHLVLGDLKGFGKLNKIYGKKITDWLKAEVFHIIHRECERIGFMYIIYGDEIGITTHPGVSHERLEFFLDSLFPQLEAYFSSFGVARLENLSSRDRKALEEDERIKVLGGYFGVDLIVFDAQDKDLQQALKEINKQAKLYDPDFNQARLWAPEIRFATQSISGFLAPKKVPSGKPAELYQEVMQHMNALLKPTKDLSSEARRAEEEEKAALQIETILNAGSRDKIERAASQIIEAGRREQSQLDKQFPIFNKTAFLEIFQRLLRGKKKVVIGRIRAYSYRYRDLKFTSFKELNDRFGSAIGDEAIQLLAYALHESFPGNFHTARESVPPDEFIFMSDAPTGPMALGRILEDAQALVSKLSELKVSFEVSLISSEEGDLTLLDKISRAEVNVARPPSPSGIRIKTFHRNLTLALDREIKELERAAARRAEADLLGYKFSDMT